MNIHIKETAAATYRALIQSLIDMMESRPKKVFYFAFSGGDSLLPMFDIWANEYAEITPWRQMRIYWTDEGCVPADDSDSNYGTLRRLLLDKVAFPMEQVFPLSGMQLPQREGKHYSRVVASTVPLSDKIPVFDCILLGLEQDGHVASIYWGQEQLLALRDLYVACVNPYTGQKRITATGTVLLAADRLVFLGVGRRRASVLHDILNSGDVSPIAYVAHHAAHVDVFADYSAYGGQ